MRIYDRLPAKASLSCPGCPWELPRLFVSSVVGGFWSNPAPMRLDRDGSPRTMFRFCNERTLHVAHGRSKPVFSGGDCQSTLAC